MRWAEKRAGRRAGDAARAEGAGPEGRAVGGVLLGAGRPAGGGASGASVCKVSL